MNFIEHMMKIDIIVNAKKEEDYKKNLFQSQGDFTGEGMSFAYVNTMQNGNLANISISSGGLNERYTVFNNPSGMIISGPGC